jgi:histidinol-phosphate/aromatic aminotransferase/cobyric acid decarboxylase-like protein
VLIRDMTGVVPGALRVTAGSEQETDLFLRSLKEVLG